MYASHCHSRLHFCKLLPNQSIPSLVNALYKILYGADPKSRLMRCGVFSFAWEVTYMAIAGFECLEATSFCVVGRTA